MPILILYLYNWMGNTHTIPCIMINVWDQTPSVAIKSFLRSATHSPGWLFQVFSFSCKSSCPLFSFHSNITSLSLRIKQTLKMLTLYQCIYLPFLLSITVGILCAYKCQSFHFVLNLIAICLSKNYILVEHSPSCFIQDYLNHY